MSIGRHAGNRFTPTVVSAESMYDAIQERGIIPFFENVIPGYSIEELTPPQYWFDGEEDGLGPWDWKIDCLQSGDIVYGKFLCGGKASFATVAWYRELRNYRRSLPKYQPVGPQLVIMDYLAEHGSITIKEVRHLLGIKKSAADALMTRLQMQCRVVLGDLTRVYNGEDLSYKGWQVASFCRPEDLFGAGSEDTHASKDGIANPAAGFSAVDAPGLTATGSADTKPGSFSDKAGGTDFSPFLKDGGPDSGDDRLDMNPGPFSFASVFEETGGGLETSHSPEESLELLMAHITELTGCTDRRLLLKVLG